jgi:hypothetical protein
MGKEIKYSGWYPNYRQPQLFRKKFLRYDNNPVHEGYKLKKEAKIGYLKEAIWQLPFKNFNEIILKMNRYSSLGANKSRQKDSNFSKAFFHGFWAFFKHFFLKLGFLNGWQGFVIAFSYFEVTFYRYCKATEIKEGKSWDYKWKKICVRLV